jgi:twinkle protein
MSKMIDDLVRQGISLKNYSVGAHKTTCPRCSHTRKDKKDPCLWVNIKEVNHAMWKCHNCVWTGAAGDVAGHRDEPQKREYKKPEPPKATTSKLPDNIMAFFTKRGISREVIERNKIYNEGQSICFPYFDNGGLVNVKYRTVDKKFRMTQGAQLTFYGLDDVRQAWAANPDERTLIIVEGELDKLALEVCGITHVLSVPNGAPARIRDEKDTSTSGFEYLAHAEELMRQATKVIIAVDNDKPGKNLEYELSRRIGIEKCWCVEWPAEQKDANGCLMEYGIEDVLHYLGKARPHPIKGLYCVEDFETSLRDYFTVGMRSGVKTGWSTLDRLYTVMPGELTVVTGVPNSGKSEFMDALMINLAKNEDWRFAIFSPEHKKEQHVAKLVEKIIGKPTSPKSANRMSVDEFMNGAAWVAKHFYFIISDDDVTLPTLEWGLEKASQAVYRFGVQGFLLDPWNEIEHQMPNGMQMTDYVGMALAKVKRWQRKHNLATWIVAHPTKIHADKDGKMRVASLYDIAGSSNWANKVDNGIVIHRSEGASNTTEVWIKKARDKHVATRGTIDLLYDRNTGLYSESKTNRAAERDVVEESEDMQTFIG